MRQRLATLRQDLRFGIRMLRRSPGFAATAVLLLGLGIGANTAIFSLVSAVFLRPLPFPEPNRLVLLWEDMTARGGPNRVEVAPADYADWREQGGAFTDMAALLSSTYNLTGSGEPDKVAGIRTTANLFTLLGLQPLVGRTLLPADDGPDAVPVVVISERLWRTRYGADPAVVGRTITLDGLPRTLVGVVPESFPFPNKQAVLWVPARLRPEELAERFNYFMYVVGRLRPDRTLAQARAEMSAIAGRRAAASGNAANALGVTVTPLHQDVTRDVRQPMGLLMSASALLLLIACANVAGLLLTHGARRRAELAMRNVLGAARGRLVAQLLTESLILATAGALLGVLLAVLTFRYLSRLLPPNLPQASVALDLRVLLFTMALSAIVVIAAGTLPTLTTVRAGLATVLRAGGRSVSHAGFRSALVVGELALTIVLLAGAGLLLRSYSNVLSVETGFDPHNLLIAETTLSPAKYASQESRTRFYNAVLERVRALPGVSSAGYVNFAPLTFKGGRMFVAIDGQPLPAPADMSRNIVSDRVVSSHYFSTLEVPVLRGRDFDDRDGPDAPRVVVINEKMARAHWPGEDPIGRRIGLGAGDNQNRTWLTVVGVVGDVRQMGLDTAPEAEFYFAANQMAAAPSFLWPQQLVVRTTTDPTSLAGAIRRAVWSVDPDQPVANIRRMADVFDTELGARNTQLTLIGAFAALALGIAVVGLYGVIAYSVSQRAKEIGLRMALGARRMTVVAGVARQSLVLVGAALVFGLAGALGVTRLLGSWLFNVGATDALTFASTALLLLVASLVACAIPAIRAATVNPAVVLRSE